MHQRYLQTKPHCQEIMRRNHIKNRIRDNERSQRWYRDNIKHAREYAKQHIKKYYKQNPAKQKENSRKYRIKKRNATGHHTEKEWGELKQLYNYICLCCGKQEPEIKLTRDHVIQLVNGGTDNISNIQPLCRSCNCKKLGVDFRRGHTPHVIYSVYVFRSSDR